MAEFYLDISAIGNEYQTYSDTPTTWGVPQDGNGKAGPGHTASVAIATINCNGASATGTGTVGVLGVTVSSTLNASGSALATAIVTAINAATTATTATYSACLLPLNRLVFARVNPGVNTEVQIMLRIAGTDWNGMLPTRANITGGSVTAFSGGADGPFAYFVNTSTVFGRVATTYGLLVQKPASITEPTADAILVRSKRNGTPLTVELTHTTAITIQFQSGLLQRHFVVDDGTIWTGDNGQFLLNIIQTSGSAVNVLVGTGIAVSGGVLSIEALAPDGFACKAAAVAFSGSVGFVFGYGQGLTRIKNVLIEAGNATTLMYLQVINSMSNNRMVADGCRFVFKRNQNISSLGDSTTFLQQISNSLFEWSGVGTNISALFAQSNYGYSASAYIGVIKHLNNKFIVDGGAYSVSSIFNSTLLAGSRSVTTIDGCTGIQNPSIGLPAAGAVVGGPEMYWTNPSDFSFRYEQCSLSTDWVKGNPYPTRLAQTPDGTSMSIRASWENARLSNLYTFEVTKVSSLYRQADAIKTVEIQLCTPAADVPNKAQVYMVVSYTDNSGGKNYESTRGDLRSLYNSSVEVPLPIGVGLSEWSLNGVSGLESRKLSITTMYPIKQGTEVVCTIFFGGTPSGSYSIYIDPVVEFV